MKDVECLVKLPTFLRFLCNHLKRWFNHLKSGTCPIKKQLVFFGDHYQHIHNQAHIYWSGKVALSLTWLCLPIFIIDLIYHETVEGRKNKSFLEDRFLNERKKATKKKFVCEMSFVEEIGLAHVLKPAKQILFTCFFNQPNLADSIKRPAKMKNCFEAHF